MHISESPTPNAEVTRELSPVIFDVDGLLLASSHERAWREALDDSGEKARFKTRMYQSPVAGPPRLSGALAALWALGVPNSEQMAPVYAEAKQRRPEQVIEAGAMIAFPDAIRLVVAGRTLGWPVAAASSLKNANAMMRQIRLDVEHSLFDAFGANVCGRDLPQGKPNPEIFLLAAKELLETPRSCFVMEDAPTGIEAARARGMAALGVAPLADAGLLSAAGATRIVTARDEVVIDQSSKGRLRRKAP